MDPSCIGTPLFKSRSCTHRLLEELGRHANRGGPQRCPNCEACNKKSVEHVLFEFSSHISQRQSFLDYLKQILTPETFEVFNHKQHFR